MGRVALVTGGTRGIGEAICKNLKDAGNTVAASYAGNDEAAQEFSDTTGIPVYKFDVSDFDACQEAVAKIETAFLRNALTFNNWNVSKTAEATGIDRRLLQNMMKKYGITRP